jgi:hypothetical protein
VGLAGLAAGAVAVGGASAGAAGGLAVLALAAVVAAVAGRDRLAALVPAPVRGWTAGLGDDWPLLALPLSLALFVHKSVGSVAPVHGGAPAVYVTSLDVVLVVLVGLVVAGRRAPARGTVAARHRAVGLPLVGAGAMLPSLLVATDLGRAAAEVVRMAWMYGLFAGLARWVRRPGQVRLVLGGLGAVAVVQLVVVLAQWRTGGVLGLGVLGVPTSLGERVVDDGTLGRPFGTMVHPVFLGATMGALALVFAGMGLSAPDRAARRRWLALVPVCVVPVLVAEARAALVGLVPAAVVVVALGVGRRPGPRPRPRPRLGARGRAVAVAGGAVMVVVALPVVQRQVERNVSTDHFSLEVEARGQLDDLALAMVGRQPELGVGLNNFEAVMDRYDRYGLIYPGYPVHDLYLLQLAETGVVGLAGLLVVGAGLLVVAVRLARTGAPGTDPVLAGVGRGFAAVVVFFAVEELAGFSLRQEVPLALWWLLAGLMVACASISSISSTSSISSAGAGAGP